jgi:hypothetical protein
MRDDDERDDDEGCPGCFRERLRDRSRAFAEALDRLVAEHMAWASEEEWHTISHYVEHTSEELLEEASAEGEPPEGESRGGRRLEIELCRPGADRHERLDEGTTLYGCWLGDDDEEDEEPVYPSILYEELVELLAERIERERGGGA